MADAPAPLRVWVVTPSLHREGGTERCLAEQLTRWRNWFAVTLYTMEARGVDLDGIRVRRLWRPPGPHLTRYVWWLVANHVLRWWDARREGRPDVLHSPGVNCLDADAIGVHIVFAKHWAEVRRSLGGGAVRANPARWLHRQCYWSLVRWLERRVYRGPATLWALSRADAEAIELRFGRPRGTVPVIPYGVDAAEFGPDQRRRRRDDARARLGVGARVVLLLVGNDWHKKGLDHAIRGLAALPPDHLLAVAGRDDPAVFVQLARSLGVESRLMFWPLTPDVLEYYAAADCLVAPSREDAFHLPALEALACGLPVVIAAAAGAAEVLGGDGGACLTVADVSDPAELSQAVREALSNPEVMARRAERGRALAAQRSWDAYAERTAELVRREHATPRALVLAADLWGPGGIQRATRSLLEACAAQFGSERVAVVSVWGPEAPLPAGRLLHAGRRRPVPGQRTRVGWWHSVTVALAGASLARRWRSRRLIVIAAHAHLSPVARLCGLVSGAPYVVWGHGLEVWGALRRRDAGAMRAAAALFAGSRHTASGWAARLGAAASPIHVIPYPVRLAPEAALPGEASAHRPPPLALAVARLERIDAYKGVDTLLLAWPLVLQRVPDAELMIVGDGNDRARLERLAAHLMLEGRAQFVGRLDDAALANAYNRARLFALPGRAVHGPGHEGEGFGLVFLEAAAAGLPCIAGQAGGAPEAVDDGVTGYLVNPDSPHDVAAAVARLLADPELAGRLGRAGRSRAAREFSEAQFRERIGALVGSLVG